MMARLSALVLFMSQLLLFSLTNAGTRMLEPPSRASLWRYGYNTPMNIYDDMTDCGGYEKRYLQNRGDCGVCGDSSDEPKPRRHEAGGEFAPNPRPVRAFEKGSYITVVMETSSSLFGKFESCFDGNSLSILEAELGTEYQIGSRQGIHVLNVQLPKDAICQHCILQWTHKTGYKTNQDTCLSCPGSVSKCHICKGCGDQVWHVGCTDIAIYDSFQFPPTLMTTSRSTGAAPAPSQHSASEVSSKVMTSPHNQCSCQNLDSHDNLINISTPYPGQLSGNTTFVDTGGKTPSGVANNSITKPNFSNGVSINRSSKNNNFRLLGTNRNGSNSNNNNNNTGNNYNKITTTNRSNKLIKSNRVVSSNNTRINTSRKRDFNDVVIYRRVGSSGSLSATQESHERDTARKVTLGYHNNPLQLSQNTTAAVPVSLVKSDTTNTHSDPRLHHDNSTTSKPRVGRFTASPKRSLLKNLNPVRSRVLVTFSTTTPQSFQQLHRILPTTFSNKNVGINSSVNTSTPLTSTQNTRQLDTIPVSTPYPTQVPTSTQDVVSKNVNGTKARQSVNMSSGYDLINRQDNFCYVTNRNKYPTVNFDPWCSQNCPARGLVTCLFHICTRVLCSGRTSDSSRTHNQVYSPATLVGNSVDHSKEVMFSENRGDLRDKNIKHEVTLASNNGYSPKAVNRGMEIPQTYRNNQRIINSNIVRRNWPQNNQVPNYSNNEIGTLIPNSQYSQQKYEERDNAYNRRYPDNISPNIQQLPMQNHNRNKLRQQQHQFAPNDASGNSQQITGNRYYSNTRNNYNLNWLSLLPYFMNGEGLELR